MDKDDDYPVKMNFGCFIPLCIMALIGVILSFESVFR